MFIRPQALVHCCCCKSYLPLMFNRKSSLIKKRMILFCVSPFSFRQKFSAPHMDKIKTSYQLSKKPSINPSSSAPHTFLLSLSPTPHHQTTTPSTSPITSPRFTPKSFESVPSPIMPSSSSWISSLLLASSAPLFSKKCFLHS